ncbi:GCN5-related N-acetyltransferase [Sphingomonas sp. Leaf22]|uniref:GCN5-related N-acetyltransferase n=1 Tax=Sphingomonas sp. Leaf22 TaxID=1735687 RepID=UPI000AF55DFC|nr:GCN5-related N-acetyltransferase [Sphingomonas sp. Leaf22]
MTGDEMQARWLALTRRELPGLAATRGWPVQADHCFQRILLDNAFGGVWYDHVYARPAYIHADPAALARAVALGEAAIAGTVDLAELNRRSLDWRGKAPSKPASGTPMSSAGNSTRTKIERTA